MEQRRRGRVRIIGLAEPLQRIWTIARIIVLLIILGLVLPRLLEALAWTLGPKPMPEHRIPMGAANWRNHWQVVEVVRGGSPPA